MNEPTREQLLQWVKQYKNAAIELEQQRFNELRALTDEKALRLADALLSIPVPNRRRESSGLVEQQAIFQRAPKKVNLVFAAALELQTFCEQQQWRFCLIGGVALQRWGEPRQTADVDITLLTGFGGEEKFILRLLQQFHPRRPDAADFALRNRVLLLENAQQVGMDIALGALPFEARTIERASRYAIGEGRELLTCSAEDLVVHKCFASRDQDWIDVRNVLEKQRGKLTLAQIYAELTPLAELKEQPNIVDRLRNLVQIVEPPG